MIFLDIETIPTQDAAELERIAADERARNAALVKPHSEAKVAENIDELVRKTALDAASGEIVCIAALEYGAGSGSAARTWSRDYREAGSERTMLQEFFSWLSKHNTQKLAGHNVLAFDEPFLRQRGFVLGLQVPGRLLGSERPWQAQQRDTMLMWTGGAPGKSISLDKLCRALGLPGKGELDGSGVWDAVRAGRIDEVVTYCAADVERTRSCWVRMIDCHELPANPQRVMEIADALLAGARSKGVVA